MHAYVTGRQWIKLTFTKSSQCEENISQETIIIQWLDFLRDASSDYMCEETHSS